MVTAITPEEQSDEPTHIPVEIIAPGDVLWQDGRRELYDWRDGQYVRLFFHEGQQAAYDSQARYTFVIAGTQGGKTSFGPWWLLNQIDESGGDYIAATSTYDLFKLKMLPEIRQVFETVLGIGRYWAGDKIIELAEHLQPGRFWARTSSDRMWGRIILRSAQSEGGLESATAKAAWLDEVGQKEFGVTAWEAVLRRVALAQGPVLGTTTPYNLGWLKSEIADKAKAGDKDIAVINFPSTINPAFPQQEFEDMQARLPTWKFNMFYKGLFERPEGLIYNDFNSAYRTDGGHKVKPFDIPQDWRRWVGVDPGANNTALIWLAKAPETDWLYIYRESLTGGKSSREHAQGAQRLANQYGEKVIWYGVGAKSETQQRMDWSDAGVRNVIEPTVSDVESGIDKVIDLLRKQMFFVFDNCTGLLDQFSTYARELDRQGNVTEKIADKATYHYLDALRYGVLAASRPRGVGLMQL